MQVTALVHQKTPYPISDKLKERNELENILKNLILTLGKIEVHGKDNLDRLLGCIQVIEKMLNAYCEAKAETEETKNEADNQQGQ